MTKRYAVWIGCLLLGLSACAAKLDPGVVNSALSEAQTAIAVAQQAGADKIVPQQMEKVARLLTEAESRLEAGDTVASHDLAIRARIEAKIATAQTHLKLAEQRIQTAEEETTRARLGQMAHQVAAAQARQAFAEYRVQLAQADAQHARGEAAQARTAAIEAEQGAQRRIRIAEVETAISDAEAVFQLAIEADAMTHAASLYAEAEKLLKQARERLQQDQFDAAISSASNAKEQARRALVTATAAAEAQRQRQQASELQAMTEAKVAIAKAQLSLDQAVAVQADAYLPEDYQRAAGALKMARDKLAASQHEEARQAAEKAQLQAVQLYERTQVLVAKRKTELEREEKLARAKDTLFKAESNLQTEAALLRPEESTQAEAWLAKANRAVQGGEFDQALALIDQVNELVTTAVARMAALQQKEQQIAKEAEKIKGVQTFVTERGVLIRFSGNMFAKGSSKLTNQVLPAVKGLAQLLNKHSQYKILIEGHTDNSGDADYNVQLSKERADTFMAYLIDAARIGRSRMKTVGLGESQPIVSNATEEGQQKNRRIDVILLTREER